MASEADIDFEEEMNPATGRIQKCVYATCCESEDTAGPVWGDGVKSVRRALMMLSEDCDCGEQYHTASNGEDKE